jgi:hypothetical protein
MNALAKPVCAIHGIELAFHDDECGICQSEAPPPAPRVMADEQVLKMHAKVARPDQLRHWVSELQAIVNRSPIQELRLAIFTAQLREDSR